MPSPAPPTTSLPHDVTLALRELRRRLEERFGQRLLRMTLFGSYARDEARPESDVDVMVLVEDLVHQERREVYEIGADVWMDTGVRLAPLALSATELASLEKRELQIALDIAREGVPV